MGNPAGVRRDFEKLEQRRFEAIRLWKGGQTPSAVARQLKVVRQTVARWVQQYRSQGKAGLRKAGRAERKPSLSVRDRQRLTALLRRGPERLGYQTPLWTCPGVADLIEREFGVRYHPGHVWKLLIALGWSPQRPTGRARERNEEQIAHWKKKVWPEIKKSPAGRAHSDLGRRKRTKSASASLPHLGAARPDPSFAVQLQLEKPVGGRRAYAVELLLPAVSGSD
jgi:transposase